MDLDQIRAQLFQTSASYDRIALLEKNAERIKQEIPPFQQNIVTGSRGQEEWNNEDGAQLARDLTSEWIMGWNPSKTWFNFPLMYHDTSIADAEKVCPNTIALLGKMGGINVAGYALLLPQSKLIVHHDATGPSFGSMALNMLLEGQGSLYVEPDETDQKFFEKKLLFGKAVIFNSELRHYAENMGELARVILYVDFQT